MLVGGGAVLLEGPASVDDLEIGAVDVDVPLVVLDIVVAAVGGCSTELEVESDAARALLSRVEGSLDAPADTPSVSSSEHATSPRTKNSEQAMI
jgi:hypothetical protein